MLSFGSVSAMPRVVVINPNSTERITDQIRDAAGAHAGATVDVVTSPRGPAAIESDQDVADSVAPMLATAAAHPADAYVVACFSDPGLDDLRRVSGVPAFGIAESAMHAAVNGGGPVGVVSSVEASIPRHERYWKRIGMEAEVVSDIAVGLGVLELNTDEAYDRVRTAAEVLVERGAAAIVLGCTGMTHMVERLEQAVGVPVVDPVQAATRAAIETLRAEEPG